MPIYNQERYLRDALEMALGQTYADLEVLAVDDGSTDSSPEILREYADRDRRLRIVTQKNRGLLGANVTGIRHAKGDYVCFYDSDDEIGSDFVSSFAELVDRSYDFIARGLVFRSNDKNTAFPLARDELLQADDLRRLSGDYVLANNLKMDNKLFVSRCNKLYRRSCLASFVDEYDKCLGVSLGEDSIFTYLLLNHASLARIVSEPSSYVYITRDDSMTHDVDLDAHIAKCDRTFEAFSDVIASCQGDLTPALLLYYSQLFPLLGLIARRKDGYRGWKLLYERLLASERFTEAAAKAYEHCNHSVVTAWLIYHHCPAWAYWHLWRFDHVFKTLRDRSN
jgi:glycosyltransferase involved in cell wall biosynthesis